MINEMTIKLKSKIENVMVGRNCAAVFLSINNPTVSFLNEIKTIISEALTNAIVHGYQEDINEEVTLKISYDINEIIITIMDNGVGIPDVKAARKPLFSTKSEEERSGLGFTIMEVFSDSLSVESEPGLTIVEVKKHWENNAL